MSKEKDNQEPELLEVNTVKLWTKRVKDAKKFFEPDFDRMRENMKFTAGLQWPEQEKMRSTKYVANFVNREVNQKVASLYARDPKALYRRRKRLNYAIWDGSMESLQQAYMAMAQAPNPQAAALIKDVEEGKMWEKVVDNVGKTLEIVYGYQCDTQAPEFKYQMKQLVRRVIINGVGYVRLNFSRQGDYAITNTGTDDSLSMRVKRAKHILEGIDDDKITEDDPRRQQLEQLFASVESSMQNGDMTNVEERIEFDFPSSTAIIVDPACKSLKGFIGAKWIAQQFILPLDEVNAYFETNIQPSAELVVYSKDGVEKQTIEKPDNNSKDPQEKPLVCLYEIFDLTTKSKFFIADGWKEFVQEPEPLYPSINRFWPIFSLTFNDIECEPGMPVHIYPPSDIDILTDTQKEWNRMREELRKHRKSNRPWYLTTEGWLTDIDIEKLGDHETCELVKVKGAPPNGTLKDAVVRFDSAPIDPGLYNTGNLTEDMAVCIGSSATNQQPQKHVAATPAMIQEQQRVSGVNSNVDDLDDLLSELAQASGEIILRAFSLDTVKRIAGRGAVFPEENRQDFLNEIFLDIVASSSGRPNKAVEIANYERIAPLLLQAGANPFAVIAEAIKRLDDRLEVEDFRPTMPPTMSSAAKPGGGGPANQMPQMPGQSGAPSQGNLAQQPVGLPGQ